MPNMPNINLKYLAGMVLLVSALMIAAALIFTFINLRNEKSPSSDVQPAIPAVGAEGQKPEKAIPAPTAPLAE